MNQRGRDTGPERKGDPGMMDQMEKNSNECRTRKEGRVRNERRGKKGKARAEGLEVRKSCE